MRVTPSFFTMHRAIKPSQGQQGTKGCLGFGVVFKMHSGDANHKTSTERDDDLQNLLHQSELQLFAIIAAKGKDSERASFEAKFSSLLLCISLCFKNGRPHIEEDSQAVQRGRQCARILREQREGPR